MLVEATNAPAVAAGDVDADLLQENAEQAEALSEAVDRGMIVPGIAEMLLDWQTTIPARGDELSLLGKHSAQVGEAAGVEYDTDDPENAPGPVLAAVPGTPVTVGGRTPKEASADVHGLSDLSETRSWSDLSDRNRAASLPTPSPLSHPRAGLARDGAHYVPIDECGKIQPPDPTAPLAGHQAANAAHLNETGTVSPSEGDLISAPPMRGLLAVVPPTVDSAELESPRLRFTTLLETDAEEGAGAFPKDSSLLEVAADFSPDPMEPSQLLPDRVLPGVREPDHVTNWHNRRFSVSPPNIADDDRGRSPHFGEMHRFTQPAPASTSAPAFDSTSMPSATGREAEVRLTPSFVAASPLAAGNIERFVEQTLTHLNAPQPPDAEEFEWRLTPPELGSLRVRARRSGGILNVRIAVIDLRTHALVAASTTEIVAALEQVAAVRVDFELETSSGESPRSTHDEQHWQNETTESDIQSPPASAPGRSPRHAGYLA